MTEFEAMVARIKGKKLVDIELDEEEGEVYFVFKGYELVLTTRQGLLAFRLEEAH